MTTLRFYLKPGWPDNEPTLCWAVLDARAQTTAIGNSWPQAWPKTDRIELILPAGRTMFTRVRLPIGTRQLTRNMIAFALEEQLANDPQANLYMVGEGPDAQGWCEVAVTEALPVTRAVAMLKSLGKLIDRILPEEVWLPPPADKEWSVAREKNLWLIRWGAGAISAVPVLTGDAERQLWQQLWHLSPPERLRVCGQRTATALDAVGLVSDCEVVVVNDYDWKTGYINTPFDFAHGELAANRRWRQWLPPLKRASKILLLLLCVQVVVVAGQAAWWTWQKASLTSLLATRSQQLAGSGGDRRRAVALATRAVDQQRLAYGLPAREGALALMAAFSEVSVGSQVESLLFDSGRLTVKMRGLTVNQLADWTSLLRDRYVRLQTRSLANDEKELILSLEP